MHVSCNLQAHARAGGMEGASNMDAPGRRKMGGERRTKQIWQRLSRVCSMHTASCWRPPCSISRQTALRFLDMTMRGRTAGFMQRHNT